MNHSVLPNRYFDGVDNEVQTELGRAEKVEQSRHHRWVRREIREGERQDHRVPEAEGEAEHGEHPDLHRRNQFRFLSLLRISSGH